MHDQATFTTISNQLFSQGWIWIETGGVESSGLVPDATTNYASAIFSQPDFIVSPAQVQKWFNKPGVKNVLASQTFRTDISCLLSLSTDQLAEYTERSWEPEV